MNNSKSFREKRQKLKDLQLQNAIGPKEHNFLLMELIADRLNEIGEENEKILESKESQRRLDEFAAKYMTPQGTLKTP